MQGETGTRQETKFITHEDMDEKGLVIRARDCRRGQGNKVTHAVHALAVEGDHSMGSITHQQRR